MITETTCFLRKIIVLFAVLVFLAGSFDSNILLAAIVPDAFEPDNNFSQAQVVVLNYHTSQNHTFHENDDEDWGQFYALAGETYKIKVANPQILICDPVIELFAANGSDRIEIVNETGPGDEEYLLWTCDADGIYYVRLTNAVDYWGSNVWYELSVDIPGAFSLPGYVTGKVTSGGNGLAGAALKADSGSGLSQSNGSYILAVESGSHTVSISKSGYKSASFTIYVPGGGSTSRNVELIPVNNSAPSISGIKDTTVTVGTPFNLTPIAFDPDGDLITFSVAGKPVWINFNTATGALSGTPIEEHIGHHGPITITVTDYFGASRSLAPFTINVEHGIHFLPAIFQILLDD
ncbi:MAG: putative Ig domain-containing protein [Desulfobulbaceae bacterium]|nr:putative Ig domain-containing protein [Desulfobulbaceae bacterium]